MKKALLISGGHINNNFIKSYLDGRHYDIIIAIDGGLEKAYEMGIMPTHIIGDFDTVSENILDKYVENNLVNIIRLIPEKDFSDTQCAISTAIENKCTHLEIVGGTGTRLDHTIANIHTLQLALDKCESAYIINENNRIRLIKEKVIIDKADVYYKYVSFLPLTQKVSGVSLKGFKYTVEDFEFNISTSLSLGVSNEILDGKAEISIKDGILIMIESKD